MPTAFLPSLPMLDPRLLLPTLEPPRAPMFPFDREAHRFYLARAGVHHAVRHFAAGGRVLMPGYHHGVEVEAVRAAGATVEFYRINRDLRLDLDDLMERATKRDTRVVYVTHFAGFAQPIAPLAAFCRERNLKLIEDCALALLSRDVEGVPLGSRGDAAVFCLYKTLPVPHGGLLLADLPALATRPAPFAATLHHLSGQILGHLELRSPALGRPLRAVARNAAHATVDQVVQNVHTGNMHLLPHELTLGCAPIVSKICRRLDLEMIIVRRRRNFRRLAEQLDGFDVIGAPLAPGVCPLFVPVRVPNKQELHTRLQARGVDSVDFWGQGDSPFPEIEELRRTILELPCHQSLDDDDIDVVARAVKEEAVHA
jgi:dTDP-4-amino-4,6-dideoxygalactose transaminase